MWLDGKKYVSPTCHLDVLDRIGGGDGFASGVIYWSDYRATPRRESTPTPGWSTRHLLTTYPGDIQHGVGGGGGGVCQEGGSARYKDEKRTTEAPRTQSLTRPE